MSETKESTERGPVSLTINGDTRTIVVEPRMTLLSAPNCRCRKKHEVGS
jgi:hypothetical protein